MTVYKTDGVDVWCEEKLLARMNTAELANALVMVLNHMSSVSPRREEPELEDHEDFLRVLQRENKKWLEHNFPLQVSGVSAQQVLDYIADDFPAFRGNRYFLACCQKIADGANSGELTCPQAYALLGLTEEIGELTHAYLKYTRGIRGVSKKDMEDAVGDIVVFLVSFCNTLGIDINLCDSVEAAWSEVKSRDWVKYPTNGKTS